MSGKDRNCDTCGGSGMHHENGCVAYPGRVFGEGRCDYGCRPIRCSDCGGSGWVQRDDGTDPLEELNRAALGVTCPRCQAKPGEGCTSSQGDDRKNPHVWRLRRSRQGGPEEPVGVDG